MSRKVWSAAQGPPEAVRSTLVDQPSVLDAWSRAIDSVKERGRSGDASPAPAAFAHGYLYQRPAELVREIETSHTVYLPVSPLRGHGAELPVGTDVIITQGLCRLAAERTGGLVLPPVLAGVERDGGGGQAIGPDLRDSAVQAQVGEWLRCLEGLGVKIAIVLCGPIGPTALDSLRHMLADRRKSILGTVVLSLPEICDKVGQHIDPGSTSEAALVGWAGAFEAGMEGADSSRALYRGREIALSLRQAIVDEARRLLYRDGR